MNQRKKNTATVKHVEDDFDVQIPSREELTRFLENASSPANIREIASGLEVLEKPALIALRRRLRAMTRDGQISHTRGNRFGIAKRMELISGRVIGHPDGFAFVRPDEAGADIFLSHQEARVALHGDRVLVRIGGFDKRERPYGTVVEVLERVNIEIVGRYFRERGVGFVTPDNGRINQDILIPKAGKKVKTGQFVVARITQQPGIRRQPIGEIVEILGEHMAPGMEIDVAIRTYDLPVVWSEDVLRETEDIPLTVDGTNLEGRRDLRDKPLVTIDGSDARDFDDAVFCKKIGTDFILYVAIADVAHYVREGTALNEEAINRGTSVYFPNNVIAMLPEALSNGICSLNPNVDRLAMVCELRFGENGVMSKYQFYNAVIKSHARLTYDEVAASLALPTKPKKDSIEFHLRTLHELYELLKQRRLERGALDFDSQEPYFVFNEQRKIERIETRERNDAHRMIEESMVAANVAAATELIKYRLAALFRNHERPDPERIESLREFLNGLGLQLSGGATPSALDFTQTLAAAAGRQDRHLIETILLRGQKLAEYSPENRGHFGLALESYAHFTSPIRRYPDLLVHRALKLRIGRRKQAKEVNEQIAALGQQCSMTERRAEEATRDVVAWLKCEYMEDKVGQTFSGVISGVTSFGLFVQLDDIFVEGLIHVTSLPQDYYEFNSVTHSLLGRASGRRFGIGDSLQVVVARVSLDDRKIDFSMVNTPIRGRKTV
ncbi:MAG: ribonuclease R [Proteobacteria bacterium]|nr:ribonuclease R [Pseudomonadota bacterium]